MRPRPSPGQAPGGAAGGSGLCEQRDSSDNPVKSYYAEGEYYSSSGKKAAYFPDQIGSVRDTVDVAGGALLYGADYTPYGLQTPSWTASGNYFPDIRFAGMFTESNSAELLTPARLYEAAEGRFMGRDPLGYSTGPNLYAYANGNPVNRLDPSGLCPPDWGTILWNAFGPSNPGTLGLLSFIPGAGLDFLLGKAVAGTSAAASAAAEVAGPGAFGAEDVALGLTDNLASFQGDAKIGTVLTQGARNADESLADSILNAAEAHIDQTGGTIRFNLTDVDVQGAMTPGSSVYSKVTSQELRGVLSNPSLSGRVAFYRNGVQVSAP